MNYDCVKYTDHRKSLQELHVSVENRVRLDCNISIFVLY